MRIFLLAAALAMTSSYASAGDAADPVREVMDVTVGNWASTDSEWTYIFGDEPLQRLFSRRFQAAYREAAKRPAYDADDGGPGDPFGYDVVTASQDGCPLEDVVIAADSGQGEVSDVKVTFKLWRCLDQAELRESINEVHFDVLTEDGRFVIDDIHRVSDEERDSVFAEMGQLATEAE